MEELLMIGAPCHAIPKAIFLHRYGRDGPCETLDHFILQANWFSGENKRGQFPYPACASLSNKGAGRVCCRWEMIAGKMYWLCKSLPY